MVSHINKIVIVESSMFVNTHVIAKVIDQTRSTYVLNYWNHRLQNWDDEPKRRKIGFVLVLGSEDSISLVQCQKLCEKLRSWAAAHIENVKRSERDYAARIQSLKNDAN